MSNSNSASIWINELDDSLLIASLERENKRQAEEEYRRIEFKGIGEVALLNGKAISSNLLAERGLDPGEWRWAGLPREGGPAMS